MGLEDGCDTGLVLGLDYKGAGKEEICGYEAKKIPDLATNRLFDGFDWVLPETSLTLSLAGEAGSKSYRDQGVENRQSSPQSTVTSFSHVANQEVVSVKQEKIGVGYEDSEFERSMRASDEDDEGGYSRKKLRLTKEQSALLEDNFKEQTTLNPKQKHALAMQLNLRPRQVEVWFQNRRARTKLKQTEVDCEFLKRCCETLKEENRRLQKELHELKDLKFSSPMYMHLPAATLTMCPACERSGAGGKASMRGIPFAVAPRPHHLYNPFSPHHHPSTAC